MFDGCITKCDRSNQFWTYIFLILPNSIQRSFFTVLENNIIQRTLENIYYLSRVWVKRVPYKRKLIDLYAFQKLPNSMLLFWRYSKICNSIPIQIGQFYPPHSSILQAVNKIHCLYANAVVQPSVQYYSFYMAWKTKVHTWYRYCHFCINAPMWTEKRWLQGIFDPPS